MTAKSVVFSVYPITTWLVTKTAAWTEPDGRSNAESADLGTFQNEAAARAVRDAAADTHAAANPSDTVIRSNHD